MSYECPTNKLFHMFIIMPFVKFPALLPSPALSHAAFDFHTSLTFFILDTCFNPIPKPSSIVSWSQICLLNSIAVFETVRSYQLKKHWIVLQPLIIGVSTWSLPYAFELCRTFFEHLFRPIQNRHVICCPRLQSAKQRLMSMPNGKQFNFNEESIFGRFDAFTRRLEKLVDIFSSIKQFDMLAQQVSLCELVFLSEMSAQLGGVMDQSLAGAGLVEETYLFEDTCLLEGVVLLLDLSKPGFGINAILRLIGTFIVHESNF